MLGLLCEGFPCRPTEQSFNRVALRSITTRVRFLRLVPSVRATTGRGQQIITQLTLKKTPLQTIFWRGRRITTPRFGSQAADLSHHLQSDAGTEALLRLLNPQICWSQARGCARSLDPVTLAVMWPKCRCQSGSPLPTYEYTIPTLLHASTRGKFSSAGWSRIQVGGDSAPPWTGDGDGLESENPAGAAGTGCVRKRALLRPENSD